MERAEAEAVYDAGREACVEFLLELSARYEREIGFLNERVARVEELARESSRTGSKPPSSDPPKTRQQRRAEARAKAKELLAQGGGGRDAGGQPGHQGSGRELLPEDQVPDHSTLGHWVQAEAEQAGQVLEARDAACAPRVRTLALDEIFFGGDRPWLVSSPRA